MQPREPEEGDEREKTRSEEEEAGVAAAASTAVMLTDACPKATSNYTYAR